MTLMRTLAVTIVLGFSALTIATTVAAVTSTPVEAGFKGRCC